MVCNMINTHNADHKQTYRKNVIICDINRQRQCGVLLIVMGSRCFRRSEYNERDNKKWLSDSMTEHDGHRRLLISMLSCLLTSIMSLWLDNFN